MNFKKISDTLTECKKFTKRSKSKSPIRRFAVSPALFSSQKMDWETPQSLFDRLNAEFHFELDVCASEKNAKCACYFTEKDNGLSKSWKNKVCWMNPPYGWEIGLWMAKAYQESRDGATVVCLVPARTDTKWFHDYGFKGEIRFLKGRVRFVGSASSAPFPSAIIVFWPHGKIPYRDQFRKYPPLFSGSHYSCIVLDDIETKKGGEK